MPLGNSLAAAGSPTSVDPRRVGRVARYCRRDLWPSQCDVCGRRAFRRRSACGTGSALSSEMDLTSELGDIRRRWESVEAERHRSEKVQSALYRIAELASAAQDMLEFYRAVHAVVGELMSAKNFFIALFDDERQLINWPYWADELDDDWPDANEWVEFSDRQARGTTAYVLRTGEPQLLTSKRHRELIEQGEVELVGVVTEDT